MKIFTLIFLLCLTAHGAEKKTKPPAEGEAVLDKNFNDPRPEVKKKCSERITFKNVTDSTMQGLIDSGQQIQIDEVYFNCQVPKRGDLIVVQKNPFIASVFRQVVALPGDTFQLIKDEPTKTHHLKVNQTLLKNPKGEPIELSESQANSFRIWAQSFKNEMPPDFYFVLSTEKQGRHDSRDFGPVVLSQVRGKILTP